MDKWEKCVEFHGHECPGLAIGFRACEAAIEKLGINFSKDEEVVCITENDACRVDAIQFLTGCTIGKGNLIFRGTVKNAYSFFKRSTGDSLRMILKPFKNEMNREERQKFILDGDRESLFIFSKPKYEILEKARLFNTIV